MLPSIGKELIEVLDIVLRWFVLRFCESNTSCILKVCSYSFYLSFSLMLSCYFSSIAFFPVVILVLHCDISQVLEFLPELFEMLRNEGYMMTEAEAAIFLPCLVEKVLLH